MADNCDVPDGDDSSVTHHRVVVVGAGITGLTVAWALANRTSGSDIAVLEASDRFGGQIRTERIAELDDQVIDVGTESLHLGAPHLARLVADLGLFGEVITAEPGSSRLVTSRGLRPLPAGVGPTGPTRLAPVVRSGLISPLGLLRAGMEPMFARTKISDDLPVGEFVRRRFGSEIADALVDPVLGNLHAGDIDRLSLASVAPQLVNIAASGRSLLLRRRAPAGPAMFASWPQGMSRLVDGLTCALNAYGVALRSKAAVMSLAKRGDGWLIETSRAALSADQVVLAVPAAVAAGLLRPSFVGVAEDLMQGRSADVATVVLGYPRAAAATRLKGNGLLLHTRSGRTLTAATWLSHKWARLRHRDLFCVRASAGRAGSAELSGMGDAELIKRIHRDIAEMTGLTAAPTGVRVTRWPAALPQLEVGHADRIARIRARLAGSGIYLAGAPFDGLGLAATVRSALATVDQLR